MDIIRRYLPFAIIAAIVIYVVATPAIMTTLLTACVASLLTVLLAEINQFIYTKVRWTDVPTDTWGADAENQARKDVAKMTALGQIYLGTAICVGLVFLSVFFVNALNGVAQP